MTVCIAAFAAKSKAIVLVSDKMLTYDPYGPSPMQSDTGVKKILHLADSGWEVLFSGSGAFADKVVKEGVIALKAKPTIRDSCQEMMECVRTAHQTVRERDLADAVFKPYLLDKDSFLKRGSDVQPLEEGLSRKITNDLIKFNTGTTLMCCGFDRDGPHIFCVGDDGIPETRDLEGFCAIGIGSEAATSRLLWEETDRDDPLGTALYEVFHAKVQAEIIQGVGYLWDAYIIVPGKNLTEVKLPVIRAIENLFEEATLSPFDKTKRKPEDVHKRWIRTVTEFAKRTLEKRPAKRKAKLIALKNRKPNE